MNHPTGYRTSFGSFIGREAAAGSGRQAEGLGQSAVAVGQLIVRGGQQLDGHMVGARLEMLAELGGNLVAGAPGDQRVDQRVAAAVAQVLLAPAQTAQVAGVVDQPEVW